MKLFICSRCGYAKIPEAVYFEPTAGNKFCANCFGEMYPELIAPIKEVEHSKKKTEKGKETPLN